MEHGPMPQIALIVRLLGDYSLAAQRGRVEARLLELEGPTADWPAGLGTDRRGVSRDR